MWTTIYEGAMAYKWWIAGGLGAAYIGHKILTSNASNASNDSSLTTSQPVDMGGYSSSPTTNSGDYYGLSQGQGAAATISPPPASTPPKPVTPKAPTKAENQAFLDKQTTAAKAGDKGAIAWFNKNFPKLLPAITLSNSAARETIGGTTPTQSGNSASHETTANNTVLHTNQTLIPQMTIGGRPKAQPPTPIKKAVHNPAPTIGGGKSTSIGRNNG